MSGLLRSRTKRLAVLVGIAALVLIGGGVTAAAVAAQGRTHSRPSATASAADRNTASGIQTPVAEPTTSPAGVPVSIDVPAISASSNLETLRTNSAGKLIAPAAAGNAGWYAAGIVPGQVGPAIIAGHIDYSAGPGIFEHLGDLRPGDVARVTMSTGRVLTFKVDGSQESAKAQFPTSSVYGPTPDPQLRLITCAGIVDPSTHLYRDNLVVFLTLVA